MTTFALKKYLLGTWLDGRDFPAYIKQRARETFASHSKFREMWNPHDGDVAPDLSWLFSWPPAGKKLFEFLECAIYLPTPQEEYSYRQAIKNNLSPEELLASKPWCDMITEITDAFRVTAMPSATVVTQ